VAQLDIYGTVSVGGILAAFARLRSTDFRSAFQRLRKPMGFDQRDHRDRMRGPQGPWPALAATTKARYAREGKRRNRRILARLPNARLTKIKSSEIRMLSRVKKFSMAHQDGPTRVGRGSILPQRQFMWISPWLLNEARSEFRRELWRRWWGMS
jgi:hypothetical protein